MVGIDDPTVDEGDTGTADLVFTVSLDAVSSLDCTVGYATSDGTATAGSDYVSKSGSITIPAGVMSTQIVVTVIGDVGHEPGGETLMMTLSSPVNCTIGDGSGTGTIVDEDPSGGTVFYFQ